MTINCEYQENLKHRVGVSSDIIRILAENHENAKVTGDTRQPSSPNIRQRYGCSYETNRTTQVKTRMFGFPFIRILCFESNQR